MFPAKEILFSLSLLDCIQSKGVDWIQDTITDKNQQPQRIKTQKHKGVQIIGL